MKANAPALYRNRAAQLVLEELGVVGLAEATGDRLDNVLHGLRVVQLVDDSALLGVWLAVRGHRVGG